MAVNCYDDAGHGRATLRTGYSRVYHKLQRVSMQKSLFRVKSRKNCTKSTVSSSENQKTIQRLLGLVSAKKINKKRNSSDSKNIQQ